MMKGEKTLSILLILTLVFSIVFSSVSVSNAATYAGKYWLKVNEQRNVVTAYKRLMESGSRSGRCSVLQD